MRVDLFFPVPLLVHDVSPSVRDATAAKVRVWLESQDARQKVAPSPEESVTTSYYQPEASILEDADLGELETEILAAARTYLEQTLKLSARRLVVERAWINIFEPGAQEAQHTHDGSLLSCSYYVDAPDNCGCIEFPDPIGARRSYRQFTKTVGRDLLTRSQIAVEPRPGRLVMFESWVPHAVQCNKSDSVRISIAVNLSEAAQSETVAISSDSRSDAAFLNEESDTGAALASGPKSDGRPFLFNDLFDLHTQLGIELEPIDATIPAVRIDNVLKHPAKVREIIGSTPAVNWKHEEGGRNFVDYYDCRLRFPIRYPNKLVALAQQVIAKVYSLKTSPADASVDVNWFMQINNKRSDFAVPHNDMTENVQRSFTCIVYLNAPDECSGGTAFFRFRKSGSMVLDAAYVEAVKENPAISETGRDYWAQDSSDQWERVGSVEMAPGRLLIFPSEYFHAAWHPQDSFFEFPRLTLAFWMVC
jgi:uncharacterized protein (TIGR02466 family)